jgi:hypothetical protein
MGLGDRRDEHVLETAAPAAPGRAQQRRDSGDGGPGLLLRLRVRLHRGRLDRDLARGAACETGVEHALRARQLVDGATRRGLARSLRRVSAEAGRARSTPLTATVPIDRKAVAPWREALLGLAERLEQPVEVSPRGVARVLMLLTDGSGPLYSPATDRPIGEAIWWAADGLALCPPHRWDCPVIMKLDPGQVGWTCARCGAIATTRDPGIRPD